MNLIMISNSRWRQPLQSRKYLNSFSIPKLIKNQNDIKDGTKRKFRIELSNGKKYEGVFTISSSEEILFPKALTGELDKLDYYEAEIIDSKIYDKVYFTEIA